MTLSGGLPIDLKFSCKFPCTFPVSHIRSIRVISVKLNQTASVEITQRRDHSQKA